MAAEGDPKPRGRPIVTDQTAESADPSLPAFLARPAAAPVYHGFPLVMESENDGWTLGMISDFGGEGAHYGDGYVVAPDGGRCGLVWECCGEEVFDVVMEPTPDRWGVYFVSLPHSLHGPGDTREFLRLIRPRLDPLWRAWTSRT